MSDQQITLKTVQELQRDDEGNAQRYHIAAYQRGYRWDRLQVKQLLEDIREFTQRRNPQPVDFYCLQPLVVKFSNEGGFEVVDGQQRLTTMLLILRYFNSLLMPERRRQLFALDYETRSGLEDFLNDPTEDEARMNIDFFHVYDALQTIDEWFAVHDNEVEKIKDAFLNQTKVIWFQLADSDDPVDAFTRLNVGKIPLTNGELIRALFLRRGADKPLESADLQMRIAHEWDLIEKTLQNDPFWYFLSNEPGPTQNRIGFLFDLVAGMDGMTGTGSDAYEVFYHFSGKLNANGADPESEWLRIKQTFMMLEEWYEDSTRKLFHIVGFLIQNGEQIADLVRQSLDCTKDIFEQRLRNLVFRSTIGNPPPDMTRETIKEQVSETLETLKYGRHGSRIRSLLLLFNVATLLENRESNIRFQFDSFKKGQWDIEHVRSVSPDNLTTVKLRADWLTEVRAYLESQDLYPEHRTSIDAFLQLSNPKLHIEDFNNLYETLVDIFGEKTDPMPDHSIANLVLLDAATNRSFKNAVFALKRKRILKLDQAGIFVPICTRNVFLKCYSERVDNAMFWNETDRESYLKTITETLTNFFLGETESVL